METLLFTVTLQEAVRGKVDGLEGQIYNPIGEGP
jgi:hypothetical protein